MHGYNPPRYNIYLRIKKKNLFRKNLIQVLILQTRLIYPTVVRVIKT